MFEVFAGGIMVLQIECIVIMAFGSGPSLILVNCEEIHAKSHVWRVCRVSVQTEICVSLVINVFERKKRLFLNLFSKIYLKDCKRSLKNQKSVKIHKIHKFFFIS